MNVCPVCEHAQAQGAECEVCGKPLAKGPTAADLAVPAVSGLEPTLHPLVDAGTDRLVGMEPTRHAAVEAARDATPDLEATGAAPVDVETEPVPDMERTAARAAGDVPTPLALTIACRYCRSPAAPGERLCARCGMRLPVPMAAPSEATVERKICSCGTSVRGTVCPSCGARA